MDNKVIHFNGLPCVTGKQKKPKEYTTTYRWEKVTCERCLKKKK